jgi:hypothetical protein
MFPLGFSFGARLRAGIPPCSTRKSHLSGRKPRKPGKDIAGTWIEGEAAGMAARVMQHEHDHLEGILYPMRMADLSRFGFNEELARFNPPKPVENERQTP